MIMSQAMGVVQREGRHFREAPQALPAQRLWLLERRGDELWVDHHNVSRYAGAVALLADRGIYVVIAISPDPGRAGEPTVRDNRRLNLERDALEFDTLDDAMRWVEATKQAWLSRGWVEVDCDAMEATR
jgi:hypothetical protein